MLNQLSYKVNGKLGRIKKEYGSRNQDETGHFDREFFFRSYMWTSEKTVCFRGNLSSRGVKTVWKLKDTRKGWLKVIWEMEASGDGLLITGGFFQLESTQSTLLIHVANFTRNLSCYHGDCNQHCDWWIYWRGSKWMARVTVRLQLSGYSQLLWLAGVWPPCCVRATSNTAHYNINHKKLNRPL